MALKLEENWDKYWDGSSSYPIGPMTTTYAYAGGVGWNHPIDSFTQWAWNPQVKQPLPVVDASSMPYSGLVTAGNKILFYGRSDGIHFPNLYRGIVPENRILNDGSTYWFAFTASCNTNKEDVTLKLNGISAVKDGTDMVIYKHSLSNTRPSLTLSVAYEGSKQQCFIGDANYTPHLIMMQIASTGDTNTPVTITTWADPDLSTDPSQWNQKGSYTAYMSSIKGLRLDTGRCSSGIDSKNYFDSFRIATTWQEAVGL